MDRLSPQTSTGGPPSKRRRVYSPSADSPRELGQMRIHRDAGPGSAHFVGSGSGIHFVRTVRNAFASTSAKQAAPDKASEEELVPGEDDQLDSPGSLWHPDETRNIDLDFQQAYCAFDELVLWSKSYFDSWHRPFPFLHAPTVLTAFEKLSMNGMKSLDQYEIVVLKSIMSTSLADRRQLPVQQGCAVPNQLVFRTTEEAIFAIQPLIFGPSSMSKLRAIVSVQIFLVSMLRLNAASRIGGLIIRMALHLGLHRCPARFEQFSASEVEMRKRIFWSIYSLDRYLSQSLGLPLGLKDDDLDVCYHDSENHHSSAVPTIKLFNPPDAFALPAFLAKHGRIKGLILELRNKSILHSNFDPDEQIRIDSEISRWWNAAQDLVDPVALEMDVSAANRQNKPPTHLKSSHKLLLVVQKHESIILLNRPVITSGHNTPAFAAAIQKCIGASKAIITNVYRHIVSSEGNKETSQSRIPSPLVWPGFVWMVWQSGLILLYAASEEYYATDVAQREASRCVAILEHLALRGTFWPSSCAAVIKELQTALATKDTATSLPKQKHTSLDTNAHGNGDCAVTEKQSPIQVSTGELRLHPHQVDQQYHGSRTSFQENKSSVIEVEQVSELPVSSVTQHPTQARASPDGTAVNSIPDIVFQSHLGSNSGNLPNSMALSELENWDNMYGHLGAPNYGDQSYDIFQLMDPSYLLSGQITPAQPPGLTENAAYMPANGDEHYQHH